MSDDKPAGKLLIAADVIKSLAVLFKYDRLANYHVRAVYAGIEGPDGKVDMDSFYCSGDKLEADIRAEAEDVGMSFIGYAVYASLPSPPHTGVFVCGDELRYKTAARIAAMLNRVYAAEINT